MVDFLKAIRLITIVHLTVGVLIVVSRQAGLQPIVIWTLTF